MTGDDDDSRGRYRTPPRGVPIVERQRQRSAAPAPTPIDPEYTPPPFDVSDQHHQNISPELAALVGDTYRSTRLHERRLITIGGEDGKGGILGAVVDAVRRHEDRIMLLEHAVADLARDRDLILQRLENIERLMEGTQKMIADIKTEQHAEKVDNTVTKWATRVAIGVLIFVATAVANIVIARQAGNAGTTTEIRYLPAPAPSQAGHPGGAAPVPKTSTP